MGRRTDPVRTCVGCRERAAKSALLRVVMVVGDGGNAVVPDPAARLPGRGAYLHPAAGCLELAVRRRAFARALRVPGVPDVTRLVEHLAGPSDSTTAALAAPAAPAQFPVR